MFRKRIISLAIMAFIILPIFSLALVNPASAQFNPWGTDEIKTNVTETVGLNADRDPRDIAATVIRVILGFLGIIAVILILYGGFLWMTASGNQENVDKAKKLLMAGVIGLVIILASFALATFVLDQLYSATGN